MPPSPAEPPALLERLSTLSDLGRLRLLRLLEREELSVGELARALQLPQSTVSRHLKVLHERGWVGKRSAGTASLYRLDAGALGPEEAALWTLARQQLGTSPTLTGDDARLAEVLTERRGDSRAFFGRLGGEWDELRGELFGGDFTAEALLSFVSPAWTIADLGCGTGNAVERLAPIVKKVVAIDREPAMLDAARRRLERFDNIEFRAGDLLDLPLDDASVDAVMVFLVLHHLPDPAAAVAEMARVLRPGGVVMIVDMVLHDRDLYRHTMGHVHLGFDESTIAGWLPDTGLSHLTYRRLRPDTTARGPGLFVATAVRT